jgi:hypothetical protein
MALAQARQLDLAIGKIVRKLLKQEKRNCQTKIRELKEQFEDFCHEMQKMELRLVIKMGSLLTVSVGILLSYLSA